MFKSEFTPVTWLTLYISANLNLLASCLQSLRRLAPTGCTHLNIGQLMYSEICMCIIDESWISNVIFSKRSLLYDILDSYLATRLKYYNFLSCMKFANVWPVVVYLLVVQGGAFCWSAWGIPLTITDKAVLQKMSWALLFYTLSTGASRN